MVEDSTLHGGNLVSFRPDYGSTRDGEVVIGNCQWHPNSRTNSPSAMFGMSNDGSHDFGYPWSMPRLIGIDGLVVHDTPHPAAHPGISFFSNPTGGGRQPGPFPYQPTEKIRVRGLKIASGLPVRVAENPALAAAIRVVDPGGNTTIRDARGP